MRRRGGDRREETSRWSSEVTIAEAAPREEAPGFARLASDCVVNFIVRSPREWRCSESGAAVKAESTPAPSKSHGRTPEYGPLSLTSRSVDGIVMHPFGLPTVIPRRAAPTSPSPGPSSPATSVPPRSGPASSGSEDEDEDVVVSVVRRAKKDTKKRVQPRSTFLGVYIPSKQQQCGCSGCKASARASVFARTADRRCCDIETTIDSIGQAEEGGRQLGRQLQRQQQRGFAARRGGAAQPFSRASWQLLDLGISRDYTSEPSRAPSLVHYSSENRNADSLLPRAPATVDFSLRRISLHRLGILRQRYRYFGRAHSCFCTCLSLPRRAGLTFAR